MTTKFNELSDLEILRLAEHERGKAVGAFFGKLFTKRDEQPARCHVALLRLKRSLGGCQTGNRHPVR